MLIKQKARLLWLIFYPFFPIIFIPIGLISVVLVVNILILSSLLSFIELPIFIEVALLMHSGGRFLFIINF
jgi:hypothetical protein